MQPVHASANREICAGALSRFGARGFAVPDCKRMITSGAVMELNHAMTFLTPTGDEHLPHPSQWITRRLDCLKIQ
jgi:hypothetical protein